MYPHLGTHATPAVDSPRLKTVTITYEYSEASSDTLPLIAVYVTCSSTPAPSAALLTPHENYWKSNTRNCDKILSTTTATLEESTGTDNTN